MSHKNNNELTSSEKAASQRSQVTPNNALKKKKEKLMFLGVVLMCLVAVVLMIVPAKEATRAENENQSDATVHETLTRNLELIAKMKEDANKTLRASGNTTPDRRLNHPPILRGTKNTTTKLSQETLARMNASNSFTLESSKLNTDSSQENVDGTHTTLTGNNANAQFVNQQDEIVSVNAKRIPHPDYTIPAGELIPATLEVAINSDLPGMVRAITTRDIYSLSGGNRLIPSGSALVGQYNSGVVQGQSRLLVVWNRVERSDGVIVTLNSPGTDAIGRAGMGADIVERHFLERFGTSALLSILGGYTAMSGVGNQDQYNSKSQYRMGVANSLQQTAGQTLEDNINIKPTLSINQGARINVFVAHDLDFSSVGAAHDVAVPQSGHLGGGAWK
jgi:type IV secretion system protein VirB10